MAGTAFLSFPIQSQVLKTLKERFLKILREKEKKLVNSIFSLPEHEVLRLSYCDHSPSIGVHRPSVVSSHFFVYTLASTNINQSARSNLVQMYMAIRSSMSSIMELIGPELSELSALELENLPYLTLFTL